MGNRMFNDKMINRLLTEADTSTAIIVVEEDHNLYVPVGTEMMSRRQDLCLGAIKATYPQARWTKVQNWVMADCDDVGVFVISEEGETALLSLHGGIVTGADMVAG